ncbi:hypothetical protein GA0070619_3555 [Micromonospora zamorensis]|nr:hypothetical protein GA0070619_3555 [Micromonospora zamorensis]
MSHEDEHHRMQTPGEAVDRHSGHGDHRSRRGDPGGQPVQPGTHDSHAGHGGQAAVWFSPSYLDCDVSFGGSVLGSVR